MKKYVSIILLLCMGTLYPVFEKLQAYRSYQKNNLERAQRYLDKVLTSKPDDAQSLYNAGKVAYKQKDFAKAEAYLQKATVHAKESLQEQAWFDLGNAQLQQKKYEAALESFQQVLLINPDNEHAKETIENIQKFLEQQQQNTQHDNQDQDQQAKDKQQRESNQNNQSNSGSQQPNSGSKQQDQSQQQSQHGSENNKNNNQSNADSNGQSVDESLQQQGQDEQSEGDQESKGQQQADQGNEQKQQQNNQGDQQMEDNQQQHSLQQQEQSATQQQRYEQHDAANDASSDDTADGHKQAEANVVSATEESASEEDQQPKDAIARLLQALDQEDTKNAKKMLQYNLKQAPKRHGKNW